MPNSEQAYYAFLGGHPVGRQSGPEIGTESRPRSPRTHFAKFHLFLFILLSNRIAHCQRILYIRRTEARNFLTQLNINVLFRRIDKPDIQITNLVLDICKEFYCHKTYIFTVKLQSTLCLKFETQFMQKSFQYS